MTDNVTLKFNNFKGIRANNPVVSVSNGIISALNLSNVELKNSNHNANVGIYTMKGRAKIGEISDKTIINMWSHTENSNNYVIVYAVNDEKGYLYNFNPDLQSFSLLYNNLSPSKNANAISVTQGFSDYLFFTNGVDNPIAISMTKNPICTAVNAIDYENRPIRGLSLASYDGRLVMLCKNRVHWSRQGDIFDWATMSSLLTDAAYQEFDREATAIVYYNNSLIVFTSDYSVAFSGNPADSSSFSRTGASGGGASSECSVVKIDNKVFYYDDKAKNLFSYYLYDSGQIRPSNGLADEVKKYFHEIDAEKIHGFSIMPLIFDGKNEIWFKIPKKNDETTLLILDYMKGEWLKRDFSNLTTAFNFGDKVISSDNHKIYYEYLTDNYDNAFVPAEYQLNLVNLDSNSSNKIIRGNIYITLDASYNNDFYIEFTIDENSENIKRRHIQKKYGENILILTDNDDDISGGYFSDDDNDIDGKVLIDSRSFDTTEKITVPCCFKQLGIRFFTKELGQNFAIKSIEFSRIKVKKAR